MESGDDNDGFKEFEILWTKKLEDKLAFENLSEEDLIKIIEEKKRNCFTLELQNEVIEKYLQRHDPAAIRGLNAFLLKQDSEKSNEICTEKIFTEEGSLDKLESTPLNEATEKAVTGLLIEIVNKEIGDLCMNSKIKKKAFDKEIMLMTCELEAFKSQAVYLENVLKLIADEFPDQIKGRSADINATLLGLIKFMEELRRKISIDLRKYSLEVYNDKKEYSSLCRESHNDTPLMPADLKLLKIDIEKLNADLSRDRTIYLDLARSFDLKNAKLSAEQQSSQVIELRERELNNTLTILSKRLLSVERYRSSLEKELIELENKKDKIKKICSEAGKVLSPKEYILKKGVYSDSLKKMKSMQRKVEYSPFYTKVESLLNKDYNWQ